MEKVIKVQVGVAVDLTIIRPNGKKEVVRMPEGRTMLNQKEFAFIQEQTKKAGRGDVISFEIIKEEQEVRFTEAEMLGMESDKMASQMAYGE